MDDPSDFFLRTVSNDFSPRLYIGAQLWAKNNQTKSTELQTYFVLTEANIKTQAFQ